MVGGVELVDLTERQSVGRIAGVPDKRTREKPATAFGTWLKYIRQLTGFNQEVGAQKARVSFDAVKRMERGELTGSVYLIAWLSWLAEQTQKSLPAHDEFDGWPMKLLVLGRAVRTSGAAQQAPKSKDERDTNRKGSVSVPHTTDTVIAGSANKDRAADGHVLAPDPLDLSSPAEPYGQGVSIPGASHPPDRITRAEYERLVGDAEQAGGLAQPAKPARVTRQHVATTRVKTPRRRVRARKSRR